jgi:hypothetical protein
LAVKFIHGAFEGGHPSRTFAGCIAIIVIGASLSRIPYLSRKLWRSVTN